MDRRFRGIAVGVLGALLLAAVSCGHDLVDPAPQLEVVVVGGDGQFGTVGQVLPDGLEALVRRIDTGVHQKDVEVEWTVQSGDAVLSTSRMSSDVNGIVRATVQLGQGRDTILIRAAVAIEPAAAATFLVYVAARPSIDSLSTGYARAGDTITVSGAGFSANTSQDVVLFSGIRGRVLSATDDELTVEVPPCLPSRDVDVTAQLGSLVSDGISLAVGDGGHFTDLALGDYVDVDESGKLGCVRLRGAGATYLVSVLSTSTVGAARYPFVLRGVVGGGVAASPSIGAPSRGDARGDRAWGTSFPDLWEASLRAREAHLIHSRVDAGARVGVERAPEAPSSVGDRRSFKVLNKTNGFDDVSAVARVVGKRAVIYVDEKAPGGGYTDRDLKDFSHSFDDFIYPTDTEAFGQPSDLDGNQRIIVLFTPTVNAETPGGSAGFVGGFFYGGDLLGGSDGNRAEIFYAIVPDPTGIFSDARSRTKVLGVVPAILAHEFQHMIHFNERILKLHADRPEALWLSEGMAQLAEELVAQAYARARKDSIAQLYRDGDEDRARRYLADPSAVSTIVATGQGNLEERGAGWLFTLYLWDQDRAGTILGRLTRSTRSGTQNVAWVTGRPWPDVFADWASAIYLDDVLAGPVTLSYPGVDLRRRLRTKSGGYPLDPETLPAEDFRRSGSLWSSSVKHYIVVPPSSGSVVVRLGGDADATASVDAGLRMRVVRFH